jgi:hypothetical protein
VPRPNAAARLAMLCRALGDATTGLPASDSEHLFSDCAAAHVAGGVALLARLPWTRFARDGTRRPRVNADVLMASRLDRVSRSVLDLHTLLAQAQREGWCMALLDCGLDTTSPQGEAMVGVSAVFSQLERRLISQRTAAALAVKKANGVRLGRPRTAPSSPRGRRASASASGAAFQRAGEH